MKGKVDKDICLNGIVAYLAILYRISSRQTKENRRIRSENNNERHRGFIRESPECKKD
jgi:hypothetical protein